jgi:hypothetical protein
MQHSMMKILSFVASFLLLSQLPSLALACRCQQPILDDALYHNVDSIVIAGKILDEIKQVAPSNDDIQTRYFAFKVKWVIKSPTCTIQKDDVIIVSTGASTASCGLDLQPNTRYTFSAFAVEADFAVLPNVVQVSVGSCAYHVQGDLSVADQQTLRQYTKENEPYPKKCTTTPCTTGADCDPDREYCDAVNNVCINFNAPCDPFPVDCFAEPCSVTDPCQKGLTCINNYCGGCNAIFLDGNRTQVCN